MSKVTMTAKKVTFTVLDMSLILSIWSGGKLDRSSVRAAVEVSDAFEPVLEGYGSYLASASKPGDEHDEAMEILAKTTHELVMSQAAFDSVRAAVKDHQGWTCRGARQLLRIEEAFSDAEDVDLTPRKVEE